MLKNIFKKCFISILVLLVILFIGMTNSQAMSNTIIEVDGETDLAFEPGRLMKYDKETNTTTEVDMSEVLNTLNNRPKSNYISKDIVSIGESTNIINENYPQPLLTDNRVAVGSMINNFPYSAICRINYNGGNGTGVLVGPNLVLTAAHVVFDKNNNLKFNGYYKGLKSVNNRFIYVKNNNSNLSEYKTIGKKDIIKKYYVDILGKIGGEIKCSVPF